MGSFDSREPIGGGEKAAAGITVLIVGLVFLSIGWTVKSAYDEYQTVKGLNTGQLEYGADGKLRKTNRELDFIERQKDMERQKQYQREVEKQWKEHPGRFIP